MHIHKNLRRPLQVVVLAPMFSNVLEWKRGRRIFIVIALAVSLSSCIGENKNQVLASCRLQYSRSDGSLGEPEYQNIGLCMQSHGFDIARVCTAEFVADRQGG
jgi:hypothetical protein